MIQQPEFGIDGQLYFASDRSGFWNLYRFDPSTKSTSLLLPEALEQEFVGAPWRFNESWYAPCKTDATKLICVNKNSLAVLDTQSRKLVNLSCEYNTFSQLRTFADPTGQQDIIVANAASPTKPTALITYDPVKQTIIDVISPSDVDASTLDTTSISVGREIEFPTADNRTAYCYFYEPKNPKFAGKGKPPLRVLSHGGPTAKGRQCLLALYSVLDHARFCYCRCELWWKLWLRTSISKSTPETMGYRGC